MAISEPHPCSTYLQGAFVLLHVELLLYLMFLGFFKTQVNIVCNTSLSNISSQEWWTLEMCTNPIYTGKLGPPILLIYSERIASQVFSIIAGFG